MAGSRRVVALGSVLHTPVGRRAGTLLHRTALAGDHRLVDGAGAIHHLAVDREALAGPHRHDVVEDDVRDRHLELASVAYDARAARLQPGATDRVTFGVQ